MGKRRNSSIELLRIISMLMIVVHHYTVHNGVANDTLAVGANRFVLEAATLGNVGVIIFVLITGYYLGRSQAPLKWQKLAKLIGQVLFYSVGIYLVLCATGLQPFGWKELIRNILPFSTQQYWFATVYIVLYILHPYINRMLAHLTRKEELRLIWISLGLFSVLATAAPSFFVSAELVQFVMFYILGDYLGRYPDNCFARKKVRLWAVAGSIFGILAYIALYDFVGLRIPMINADATYLLARTSPLAILLAVGMFSCFVYRKAYYHPVINAVALTMFGIYLIHDNIYIRQLLWTDWLKNAEVVRSKYMILHLLFAVVVTFGVCMILELIRQWVVKIASPLRSRR